jgi:acetyltransferase-like isoleucine patch superfamily enzyme
MNFYKETLIKTVKNPFKVLNFITKIILCKIKSIYYSWKIDEGGGKIIFKDPYVKFSIKKHKSSVLHIKGNLKIVDFMNGNNSILISMDHNSKFEINGDFNIGPGVKFDLYKDAVLIIGGKDKESESGITADSLVMVFRKIEIGKDFLCAWNTFITDSDWHQIEGQNHHADVSIGDHVWIANNNNILKGSKIGNNSIIASNSKIVNKSFPDDVLIGGLTPKIFKRDLKWCRDILPQAENN